MIIFFKMEALGNDFVLVNCINEKINYNYGIVSKFLCDRNYGVGADGVIFFFKSIVADFKMRIFNKDGSEAEMCGNGIRCLAKLIYDKKITEKNSFTIETLAGIRKIVITNEMGVEYIEVDMGNVHFDKYSNQIYLPKEYYSRKSSSFLIEYNGESREYNFVSVGNPHVVCFVKDFETLEFEKIGAYVEKYKFFPQNTNVEFCKLENEKKIKVKVWERGVGRTLGCGTGAVAAASVAMHKNIVGKNVEVELDGGMVEVFEKDNRMYLKGEARIVFEGKVYSE